LKLAYSQLMQKKQRILKRSTMEYQHPFLERFTHFGLTLIDKLKARSISPGHFFHHLQDHTFDSNLLGNHEVGSEFLAPEILTFWVFSG